jgi:hypothetical protein
MLEAEWRQVLGESMGLGTKEDESSIERIWAARFHHVTARSRLTRILKLMNCLFLLLSNFLSGRNKLQIIETADTESTDMGHDCILKTCVSIGIIKD